MNPGVNTAVAAVTAFVLMIAVVVAAVTGVVAMLAGGSSNGGDRGACAPTGTPVESVDDYGPDQMANADTIVAVGKKMGVPDEGFVVAIATALQESTLRNLDYGDRDSLGLYQQRPSQGWGSADQVLDPAYSATQFYRRLLQVPNWQRMSVNDAAQTVQKSGTPHAYGRHEPAARAIAAAVGGVSCAPEPSGAWAVPVEGQCSSGFGLRHGEFHEGQDLAAPIGTPIRAASTGTVIDAGPATGYGLWIRIQHPSGVVTTYGHNNRNLVQPGQTVLAGKPIAEVGSRGQSTGPHLHFQIGDSGHAVDPIAFYRQHSAPPLCG